MIGYYVTLRYNKFLKQEQTAIYTIWSAKCDWSVSVWRQYVFLCMQATFWLLRKVPSILLAHLSRRRTWWAYSIPMVRRLYVVRCRRPHFQTWISLKPVDQSWSSFISNITWERLHKVVGQIRLKFWFPWQQKAPIDLKRCVHIFSVVFYPNLLILAGNEGMHNISVELEFRLDRTTDYGVSCPWASKTFPIDL